MSANHSFGRRMTPAPIPMRPHAPPKSEPPPPPYPPASSAPEESIIELRNICLARLDPAAVAAMPEDRLTADVERLISEIATERRIQLNAREQRALAGELVDDILGLGPLEPLLEDETVSEIMVNGPDKTFIERSGKLMLSHVRFRDTQHLANICQRIAAAVGRRIDEASPMVDARLRDGSRVNIVFPPLALDGPYVSIRKFGRKDIDFGKLVEWKAMSRQVARILEIGSQARLNVIISGGTGSGKTTLLNAMSRLIAPGERIVTVEDTAELRLQQPHVVRLETRPASLEGKGEITQRELMKNALRMRPDRIIIGEVRGGEAFDMLQAMNTGHDGSMSTIHANTTRDALTRVENMVQMGQMGLPSRAIRTQIVSAIELIVQVERQRDGGRRVTQVTEVCGMEGEVITMNDIFQFEVQGEGQNGKLFGRYNASRTPPSFQRRLAYFGLDKAWKAAMDDLEP
ncbi:MAG TPA: CpaF family protein [Acetobacteraceae bacterium]|nr:CpaF family protein [Acetobacteraceae bacterium]